MYKLYTAGRNKKKEHIHFCFSLQALGVVKELSLALRVWRACDRRHVCMRVYSGIGVRPRGIVG